MESPGREEEQLSLGAQLMRNSVGRERDVSAIRVREAAPAVRHFHNGASAFLSDPAMQPAAAPAARMYTEDEFRAAVEAAGRRQAAGPGPSEALFEDMQRQMYAMNASLKALEESSNLQGPLGGVFPSRPSDIPFSVDKDIDQFEPSHGGHQFSQSRATNEDYLGVNLTPKAFSIRRARLGVGDRIDVPNSNSILPGSSALGEASGSVVMIGEVRLEGTAKKTGVPARPTYNEYGQARMTDLYTDLSEGRGPHASSYAGRTYAMYETRVMLVRYQYLQAVETYLLTKRKPQLDYDVVWHYLCLIVMNLWHNTPEILRMGELDTALAMYALAVPRPHLAVRVAPLPLTKLASVTIVSDWLREAQMLADDRVVGKTGGGSGGDGGGGGRDRDGGGGGGEDTKARCDCCGGMVTSCGGYRQPRFLCQNSVARVCPAAGCKAKHMSKGHRAWTCKAAKEVFDKLKEEDQREAFKVNAKLFLKGMSGVDDIGISKVMDVVKANTA